MKRSIKQAVKAAKKRKFGKNWPFLGALPIFQV
jgi:hypothetical protein